MNTKYEDEIICPYCGTVIYDFEGSIDDGRIDYIECDCGEEFKMKTHVSVNFSTYKKTCDKLGGICEYAKTDCKFKVESKEYQEWKCNKCEHKIVLPVGKNPNEKKQAV